MRRALCIAVLVTAALCWGTDRKLSPDLRGARSSDVVDVIVQFRVSPAQQHKDKITQHGGVVKQGLGLVKGVLAAMPAARAAELANDADVAYVSPDRPLASKMNNAAVAVLANYAWKDL